MLLQYSGGLVPPSAYVWANDKAATETYTPNPGYAFNSNGGEITSTRLSAGTYSILLPGHGTESGNIQVTPMRSDPGVSCEVERWVLDGDSNKKVQVYCFDTTGTRVDAEFSLLYADGNDAATAGVTTTGAFFSAGHAGAKERYTPAQAFQFSTAGVPAEVERTGMGTYTVYLNGIGTSATTQITTFGSGPAISCNTPGGSNDGTTITINVFCFDSTGAPTDTVFNLSYLSAAAS